MSAEVEFPEPGPGAVVEVDGVRFARDSSDDIPWCPLSGTSGLWIHWADLPFIGTPILLLPAIGEPTPAERIAAALTIHTPCHTAQDRSGACARGHECYPGQPAECVGCGHLGLFEITTPYPCPTARALGMPDPTGGTSS